MNSYRVNKAENVHLYHYYAYRCITGHVVDVLYKRNALLKAISVPISCGCL